MIDLCIWLFDAIEIFSKYFFSMLGANLVKWTKKLLWYIETKVFFYQTLKSSRKMLFELEFFHSAIYCCVKYSNIE